VLTLAARLRSHGSTLADRLDEIARRYGVHETDQLAIRVNDIAVIRDAMTRLRAKPPQKLIGDPVNVTDMLKGFEQLPPTDGVRIVGGAFTVTIRPSGTEPKLKCYLEARLPRDISAELPAARAKAHQMLHNLRSEITTELGLSSSYA